MACNECHMTATSTAHAWGPTSWLLSRELRVDDLSQLCHRDFSEFMTSGPLCHLPPSKYSGLGFNWSTSLSSG